MKIQLVDNNHEAVLEIKVELSDKTYLVVPSIINHEFDYMKPRLMDVRRYYMDRYIKDPQAYHNCRNGLVVALMNVLDDEIRWLRETKEESYFIA